MLTYAKERGMSLGEGPLSGAHNKQEIYVLKLFIKQAERMASRRATYVLLHVLVTGHVHDFTHI